MFLGAIARPDLFVLLRRYNSNCGFVTNTTIALDDNINDKGIPAKCIIKSI